LDCASAGDARRQGPARSGLRGKKIHLRSTTIASGLGRKKSKKGVGGGGGVPFNLRRNISEEELVKGSAQSESYVDLSGKGHGMLRGREGDRRGIESKKEVRKEIREIRSPSTRRRNPASGRERGKTAVRTKPNP